MKRTILWVILMAGMLAACAVPSTAPTDDPTNEAIPDMPPANAGDAPAAALSAQFILAGDLGVAVDEVQIVSYEPMEWPNACLGYAGADEMCAQVITPGWRVVLQADGASYEAHTDQTGTSVRFAP